MTLETVAELKQRLDAGEDIAKVMNDTMDEMDRLAQYHQEMRAVVDQAIHNPDLTDEEVEDYVAAANQMLAKQGIKQFKMPKIINRQAKMLLRKEKIAALKQNNKNSKGD